MPQSGTRAIIHKCVGVLKKTARAVLDESKIYNSYTYFVIIFKNPSPCSLSIFIAEHKPIPNSCTITLLSHVPALEHVVSIKNIGKQVNRYFKTMCEYKYFVQF